MLLRKGTEYFLFLALVLVPFITLVQFDGMIYPYVTGKHFTFRFLILLAGAAWFSLCLIDRSLRPHGSSVLKSLLGLMGVVFIANLFGANFWNSFWSNYSRMEGFVSLLFFLLFFLLLGAVLTNAKRWRIYWLMHVLVSVVILAIAVLQKLRVVVYVDYNRVDSVFGNASYLAIYASMIFFLCLYLYFNFKSKWVRIFLILASMANLASIYLSQTRSAALAVLIGLAFFAYSLAKNKKAALAMTVGSFVLFGFGVLLLKERSGLSTNLFERFAKISLQDTSTQARIEIWAYCLRAFLDHPFLGWGQENFGYLSSYFKAQLWSTPWVDRAHNIFLEWMISAGILGLVSICALLLFIVKGVWQAPDSQLNRSQKVALLCFFFSWLINQFLSIDFFSISILFYSLAAYVHSLQSQNKGPGVIKVIPNSGWTKVMMTAVFIGVGLLLNYEINVSRFLKNIEIYKFSNPGEIAAAEKNKTYDSEFEKVYSQTYSFERRELRALIIQNSFHVLNQARLQIFPESYVKFYFEKVNPILQKEIRDDPQALFFKHMAANFYMQYFNFSIAENLFQELTQKVPQQQLFWIDFANMRLAQGKLEEGLTFYKKALDLEPVNPTARMFMALGLIYNRRFSEGNDFTNQLMKENHPFAFDERLINAYLAVDQTRKVDEIMRFRDKYYGLETK